MLINLTPIPEEEVEDDNNEDDDDEYPTSLSYTLCKRSIESEMEVSSRRLIDVYLAQALQPRCPGWELPKFGITIRIEGGQEE